MRLLGRRTELENEVMKIYTGTEYSPEKRRDIKKKNSFAPFESNLKPKKSTSGKRHPDEAHSPEEEATLSDSKNSAIFRHDFWQLFHIFET